ncbi:MAG: SAM-dependent methyltransferase [Myxococcota bacterium]
MTAEPDVAPLDEALALVRDAFERGVLAKVVLAAPSGGDARQVVARPVQLSAGRRLQLVAKHPGRDATRNLPLDEGLDALRELVPAPFRHLHLHTTERTLQLEWRNKGRVRRADGPPSHTEAPSERHDRRKQRVEVLDPRWLSALGLTDAHGRPERGRGDKLRQVQRYVEVLEHWLGSVPRPEDGAARWVDVGCGNGALTFALWAWLRASGWGAAEVVGIELRPALAAKAEAVARAVGADGLSFRAGAMADQALGPLDGVVALHACDTATDDALSAGVAAGARWLVVAPCCHKELRPQLQPADPAQQAVLHHGILRTRQAEIATDALRAAVLEAAGYAARVFEFVSPEHTDKNVMITAARRDTEPEPVARERVRALAAAWGVRHQRLADALQIPLA